MTALPSKASFTGASVTQGQFKTAMDNQNDYLTGLLGSDGVPATARGKLGAAASSHTHTAADVGAASSSHTHMAADVGAVPTTQVSLSSWKINESSGVLYFSYNGVNKFKLDSSGNMTVVGDSTAFGTV